MLFCLLQNVGSRPLFPHLNSAFDLNRISHITHKTYQKPEQQALGHITKKELLLFVLICNRHLCAKAAATGSLQVHSGISRHKKYQITLLEDAEIVSGMIEFKLKIKSKQSTVCNLKGFLRTLKT